MWLTRRPHLGHIHPDPKLVVFDVVSKKKLKNIDSERSIVTTNIADIICLHETEIFDYSILVILF